VPTLEALVESDAPDSLSSSAPEPLELVGAEPEGLPSRQAAKVASEERETRRISVFRGRMM
jgi:hypothetical protein